MSYLPHVVYKPNSRMYRSTPSGSSPDTGSPEASRPRSSLALTSIAVDSTHSTLPQAYGFRA